MTTLTHPLDFHFTDRDNLTPSSSTDHSRYESSGSSTYTPQSNSNSNTTNIQSGIVCLSCGNLCAVAPEHLSPDARLRIAELEAHLQAMHDKAMQVQNRLAEYEGEISRLRSAERKTSLSGSLGGNLEEARPKFMGSGGRFSSFLSRRGSPSNPSSSMATPEPVERPPPLPRKDSARTSAERMISPFTQSRSTTPPAADPHLQAQLQTEQNKRQEAESQLVQMQEEMEDLSTTLFGQANEMVAVEKKARVKAEERILVLERRDGERRLRLDRLETAVRRIERVRTLLVPPLPS